MYKFTFYIFTSTFESVGSFAFDSCALESVLIPKFVTQIGEGVFEYCSSLETIYCVAEENPDGWSDDWLGDCEAEVI